MSKDTEDIQYWHPFVGTTLQCSHVLAGNIPCGGTPAQHPLDNEELWEGARDHRHIAEPELPTGVDRALEWEATRDVD